MQTCPLSQTEPAGHLCRSCGQNPGGQAARGLSFVQQGKRWELSYFLIKKFFMFN